MVYTVIRFFFVYCLFLFLCEGMTLEDGLEEKMVTVLHKPFCLAGFYILKFYVLKCVLQNCFAGFYILMYIYR